MGIIPKVVLAAIFTFMAVLECSGVQLKIISFNIKDFGDRDKLYKDYARGKGQVSDEALQLAMILRDYDIIFIQEIKGSTNSQAVTDLADILNEPSTKRRKRGRDSGDSDSRHYEVVWPGCFFDRTGNWETYAYYINTGKITKWDANLYPSRTFEQGRSRGICGDYMGPGRNGISDRYFVRPPYSLCVKDNDKKCLFFLLGLHAKPLGRHDNSQPSYLKTTKEELDNLKTAFRYFENHYGTSDAILMGDLNADGEYLTFAQFRDLELTKSGPGDWIYYPLGQQQYTNTNGDFNVHPAMYDRFYGTTDDMLKCVNNKAEVVNGQRELIRKISDHYPIAITINCDKFDLDGSGGAAAASCQRSNK